MLFLPTLPVEQFGMDQLCHEAVKYIHFWKETLDGCLKIQSIHMGESVGGFAFLKHCAENEVITVPASGHVTRY